ncbi:hypothetical protein FRB99_000186 [Tulasnella sp. 403]|nr:hypothetical protein FRB99_000186 [Tulasnella sp. 403]
MSAPAPNSYSFYLPPPANIDPALATTFYQQHPNQNPQLHNQGMFPPPTQPTPASDVSVDSPTAAASADPSRSASKSAGKRPVNESDSSRKKSKLDHDPDDDVEREGKEGQKVKATRGSRKSEALQRSLNKMEKTLDIVLRSLGNPALQNLAETLQHSRSPSPAEDSPSLAHNTANLMSPSPSMRTPEASHHLGTIRSETSLSNRPPPSSGSVHTRQLPQSPKLDSLPDSTLNPLGLLADTSLAHRREKESIGAATEDDHLRSLLPVDADPTSQPPENIGLANDRYFKPGPMTILPLRRLYIERQIQPEMLTFVTKEEVIDLFKIFFEYMNPHCSLLDPNWHTPSLVCSRSPFLLTAICAVASKFYPARSDIHQRLNRIAKKLAFNVPEQGFKSVEIVQAYLILSLWGCGPVERFEQERTWIILGLAVRVATDINLHRKVEYVMDDSADGRATNLEIRNRERTWLLCYALDRSFSSQMGKPHSVKEDYIIRNASRWWQHPQALPLDVGLAAYVEYQRTLSRSLDFLYSGVQAPSGLQTDCDYMLIIKTVESQLSGWIELWSFHTKDATATGILDRVVEYRGYVAQFYYHYATLVLNSFGLQNALERSPVDIPHFFGRCHSAATTCTRLLKDCLGPKGYLRYSPDSHFVFISYAVLTLLKLIRPEFKSFIDNEQGILDLVGEVADLLETVAVTPYHTPALYSTFLRALITSKSGRTRQDSPALGGSDDQADRPMDPSATIPVSGGTLDGEHRASNPSTSGDKAFSPPRDVPMTSYNPFTHFNGETGPVQAQDMSTFPPTFAAPPDPNENGVFSMDNILGNGFWDSVLIPGDAPYYTPPVTLVS